MKSVFAHDHIFINDGECFYSRSGFPQSVLQRYANAFGAVDVICRSSYQRIVNDIEPIQDERVSFFPQKNIREVKGVRYFFYVNKKMSRLIEDSDVVVARLPSTLGLMAARLARKHNKVCLVEVVGNAFEASKMHGSKMGFFSAPIEHYLMAKTVLNASTVVYITSEYLQSVYPTTGDSYVCPNVKISAARMHDIKNRLELAKSKKRKTIGLVGSLNVDYKGHEVALRVLKKIHQQGFDNVKIELVGPGDPSRWKEIAEGLGISLNVVFKGYISPGDRMYEWLDTIDVLLQPSLTEGQGRAIIEAMSRGCPVVASNVGGIPELLSPECVFDANDVDGFSNACLRLLNDLELCSSVCERNFSESRRFLPEVIEEARRTVFDDVIRKVEGNKFE
ncbi:MULTISPECIES: glycosyltransferase [unclassified Alcanivorax]|uniref:glycosyltransferase n=1 Tax=unclassified Alcanivorax TaxID=2638842 RepID=UPI0012FF4ECC|nr:MULTISPECIES: glycosyltransferase [unclassified Alcanivorax]